MKLDSSLVVSAYGRLAVYHLLHQLLTRSEV